jgi:hypothetical protein
VADCVKTVPPAANPKNPLATTIHSMKLIGISLSHEVPLNVSLMECPKKNEELKNGNEPWLILSDDPRTEKTPLFKARGRRVTDYLLYPRATHEKRAKRDKRILRSWGFLRSN